MEVTCLNLLGFDIGAKLIKFSVLNTVKKLLELRLRIYDLKNVDDVTLQLINDTLINTPNDLFITDKFNCELKYDLHFDFNSLFVRFYVDYLENVLNDFIRQDKKDQFIPVYLAYNQWNPEWTNFLIKLKKDDVVQLKDFLLGYLLNKPFIESMIRIFNTAEMEIENKIQNPLPFFTKDTDQQSNSKQTSKEQTQISQNAENLNRTDKTQNDNSENLQSDEMIEELRVLKNIIQDDFLFYEALRFVLHNIDLNIKCPEKSLISPFKLRANVKFTMSLINELILKINNDELELLPYKVKSLIQLINEFEQNETAPLLILAVSYLIFIYMFLLYATIDKDGARNLAVSERFYKDINLQNNLLTYLYDNCINLNGNRRFFVEYEKAERDFKNDLKNKLINKYKYIKDIDTKEFFNKVVEELEQNNRIPKDFKLGFKIVKHFCLDENSRMNDKINHNFIDKNTLTEINQTSPYNLFKEFLNTPVSEIKMVINKITSDDFLNSIRNLLPVLKDKIIPQIDSLNTPLLSHTLYLYTIILNNLDKETIQAINHSSLVRIIHNLLVPYLVEKKQIKNIVDYFSI